MLVVQVFLNAIKDTKLLDNLAEPKRISVVGGSPDEPEIQALRSLGLQLDIRVFGVDSTSEYLDLNSYNTKVSDFLPKADLVLCSQVLEHVWKHENAFYWLQTLTDSGGYLWIGAPAANRPHGAPHYYSSGFSGEFIANHLTESGMDVLSYGVTGSKRLYAASLTTNLWLTANGHRFPLFDAYSRGAGWLTGVRSVFRRLPSAIRLSMWSPKIRNDIRYATEAWALARKPDLH